MDTRPIECLVWDLDDTVWDGVLPEDPAVHVRPLVADVIAELDRRGIRHSIATRNDEEVAVARLRTAALLPYLLHPRDSLFGQLP